MEIRTLTTFVKVAQLRSFSKAAKELGYSQAAITIQIQQLEKELHTKLFERFNKSIQLSDQGELFLIHARDILQAVEGAKTCMKQHKEPAGQLRIGTIESLCTSLFPQLIYSYHSSYPKVSITLETDSPEQLIKRLEQNQLDLVYLLDQPILNQNLCKIIEEQEEVVFVCSAHHPITRKQPLTMHDLCKEDWVLTEENASYRCALHTCLAQHELLIQPVLEVANTELIISIIKDHFGISFLPKSVVMPYLTQKELVILRPEGCVFSIYRQLLYHKHKWLSAPMQAFIQLIQPHPKEKSVDHSI